MTTHTNDRGRRLEDLYEACMKLPEGSREDFIASRTEGEEDLARQLRPMIQLQTPPGVSLFGTLTQNSNRSAFDLVSGTEFGKCRIIDPIGAGGMGAVYYAVDLQNHDRPVALKVMQPTLLRAEDRSRFPTETAALSRLIHPNIARLYFRGIENWNGTERPFLVMEYVDGKTLDKFLAENPLSTWEILELLRKIAAAVHYGHLKGVFHRDLKPSNILVTPDGEPKIIDYGVSFTASAAPAPAAESPSHDNAGTIPYMAPEVASGAAYVPDARTDVYSLGIIAFEAFARRRPGVQLPSGETQLLDSSLSSSQTRQKISECERERLRRVNRKFAFDLECVIAKALRLKIDQRHADAAEFAEDLRRLIHSEPIKELDHSRVYTTKLFVRRNRLAVTAVLVVFVAVVAAAVHFRVDETRVQAALHREAILRNQAELQRDQIQQQNAAAHFRSANLAEQRGNWSVAFEEYRLAEEGHFPNRQALAVGELRSLGRLDHRSADTAALIKRVQSTMPEIAASPQFQVVKGFIEWSTKPDESLRTIQQALVHADQLAPADRAFAEALITDDIKLVASKLQETVRTDPFNHDAWVLLGFCDVAMGDAQKCEQDAGVLQRLYPEDQVAAVLGALAAAFEGHGPAANEYLAACVSLPPDVRSALADLFGTISRFHSIDDMESIPVWTKMQLLSHLAVLASQVKNAHAFPTPVTFSRFTALVSQTHALSTMENTGALMKAIAALPNGNGEFAAGELDFLHADYASAIQHFQAVLSTPGLIDCRRRAAFFLTCSHAMDRVIHKLGVDAQGIALIQSDLDRLISLGGVHPEISGEEYNAVACGVAYHLYPQVRALSLVWLSHAPDDPRALYYLAVADANLGDRETALHIYKQALEKKLDGNMKADAQNQVRKLTASTTTKPATMPL